MKKLIQTLVVIALAVVTLAGCKTNSGHSRATAVQQQPVDNTAYDHGIQGNVVYTGAKGTNKVEVDIRYKGTGPVPKIVIPGEERGSFGPAQDVQSQQPQVQPQPQQPTAPYHNAPFPPMKTSRLKGLFNLNRGMMAWHSTPGAPVGGSVLMSKPCANKEMVTSVAWNGGTSYYNRQAQGSDVSSTIFNGRLVAGSANAWATAQTEVRNPVLVGYDVYGNPIMAMSGQQNQNNFVQTGGGAVNYSMPQQFIVQKATNYY